MFFRKALFSFVFTSLIFITSQAWATTHLEKLYVNNQLIAPDSSESLKIPTHVKVVAVFTVTDGISPSEPACNLSIENDRTTESSSSPVVIKREDDSGTLISCSYADVDTSHIDEYPGDSPRNLLKIQVIDALAHKTNFAFPIGRMDSADHGSDSTSSLVVKINSPEATTYQDHTLTLSVSSNREAKCLYSLDSASMNIIASEDKLLHKQFIENVSDGTHLLKVVCDDDSEQNGSSVEFKIHSNDTSLINNSDSKQNADSQLNTNEKSPNPSDCSLSIHTIQNPSYVLVWMALFLNSIFYFSRNRCNH